MKKYHVINLIKNYIYHVFSLNRKYSYNVFLFRLENIRIHHVFGLVIKVSCISYREIQLIFEKGSELFLKLIKHFF